MTPQVISPSWLKAKKLRDAGAGWEDLMVKCGLTEAEARLFVFGRDAYMRWAMKRKAS
jgi:hypothetical protein